ncbi:oligoendopeptidase F [Sporolactobacillus inulinus]|uniref:Oligoendopeptidase F n=1 Tax=Sporolactobacillus inulinus TaxID=2078 RepID=A0A4Y1ZAJ0_9BACL|nr:hypothetical protein [Sporolactobacillus inulinus]GAY76076.1 oligoendopeptidase F [Sporolactobacillus inulinus]
MEQRLKREQVPTEQTWNLKDLFPTQEAYVAELNDMNVEVAKIIAQKSSMTNSSKALYQALETYFALKGRLWRLSAYVSLKQSADSSNAENQADAARVDAVITEIETQLSFLRIN